MQTGAAIAKALTMEIYRMRRGENAQTATGLALSFRRRQLLGDAAPSDRC